LRKFLKRYCNYRNEIEQNVDSTFERKYSKYKITYHKFIPKKYIVKNVSNSHCTLYIHNFLSLENVEISMQVLNRQLFVITTSFRETTSDWVLSNKLFEEAGLPSYRDTKLAEKW